MFWLAVWIAFGLAVILSWIVGFFLGYNYCEGEITRNLRFWGFHNLSPRRLTAETSVNERIAGEIQSKF